MAYKCRLAKIILSAWKIACRRVWAYFEVKDEVFSSMFLTCSPMPNTSEAPISRFEGIRSGKNAESYPPGYNGTGIIQGGQDLSPPSPNRFLAQSRFLPDRRLRRAA